MIENLILKYTVKAIKNLFQRDISIDLIQIQKTKKEFDGDFTLVAFNLVKYSAKPLPETAELLAVYLKDNISQITQYNIIKGFINFTLSDKYWLDFFLENNESINYGLKTTNNKPCIVVEYSSPNTNKPLHLGHIRNNLLGYAVSEILKANGENVVKVNLVNDRGIHICKSMLAWSKWGNGETPQSSGIKGDHLVGKYYVIFDTKYKEEINKLIAQGYTKEKAEKEAALLLEAQNLLRKWESGNKAVIELWKTMNSWVYDGFDKTYKTLGIDFDKTYYESNTYLHGKEIVNQGLLQGKFQKKEDGSVTVDMTDDGFDEKVLLRSDGTSVYITQDLGTAVQRYNELNPQKLLYVVGNEQNYHFDILKVILKKSGYQWADNIFHLSYGMVELPEGKMKSREGTVVDADDLIEEMITTAKNTTEELGKTENFTETEAMSLYKAIALGALKYFILKVDPKKSILFNPKESIDFNGNTGPFIQYTFARIQSLKRKSKEFNDLQNKKILNNTVLSSKEKELIRLIYDFPAVINSSSEAFSPALLANYVYELSREYNQFYQEINILKEDNRDLAFFRLSLSLFAGKVIETAMSLLGINVPDKM